MTDAWGGLDPEPRVEHVGAWTVSIIEGGVDDISIGGVAVLRSIRAVVRDHDWRTISVMVQAVECLPGLLRLDFRTSAEAAVDGQLIVRDNDGSLIVETQLIARASFRRNRIGLVVLHAAALAGTEFENGAERLRFPEQISPHQPAREIRGLRWTADGRANVVVFSGDVFEMEDQRNWTDASYKTYSTPLGRPFPVDVKPGDVVRQSVRVSSTLAGSPATPKPTPPMPVIQLVDGGPWMPSIAIGASTAPDAERPAALPALPADAVLVELRAMDANWRAALERARIDASGLPLDVRIVVSAARELGTVLDAIKADRIVRVAVYDAASQVTEPHLWRALIEGAAARDLPPAVLIGGTRAHFTELNRTHDRLGPALPALTFSVTPQMHDRATRQIVESIAMQGLVARDATVLAAGRPVHVGPVTLRPRTNFVATTPDEPDPSTQVANGYGPERTPNSSDLRQIAEGLAPWTIASVAALTRESVASIAYFEAWGPRGIYCDNRRTAAWTALERLRALAGRQLLAVHHLPEGIEILASRDATRIVGLIASMRRNTVTLPIALDGLEWSVKLPPMSLVDIWPAEVMRALL